MIATRFFLLASLSGLILAACSGDDSHDASGQAAAAGNEAAPAIVAPATDGQVASGMAAEFRQFLDQQYEQDMLRYPLSASIRGIKTNNDQWNNLSEAFEDETRAINEQRLARLQDFDRAQLGDDLALSYDLFKLDLERQLAADEYRHQQYVIHQMRGPHTLVPSSLINIHRVTDLEDAQDYVGRLQNVGTLFDQVIEQLRIREREGFFLADWQYPIIVEAAQNVTAGAPFDDSGEDSALWADFKTKVAGLELEAAQQEQLLAAARQALLGVVEPAYTRLVSEVEAQSRLATGEDGVWKFADGDDFYAERLRWYTTTDMSAAQVHQLGLEQVERIHGEMRGIMQQVGFDGSLQDFFTFMREDPQFYYPNTDEGRDAYLRDATHMIDTMRERLPEVFGLLPKAELTVKRVEPFRERSAGKAFYQGPPPDGSRPGIYYANLYDMNDMPIYQMEALAYHEGVPGHHMQRAISVELQGIPEFQKYASFTAYTEGWGLYTELLPKEMGFYQDPYSDFGRLAMELWRAARLVVDTGLHDKRWTREEAIDYLQANTPNPPNDAVKAIERYIAMPGQATAYMIGKQKILELRERARSALGEQFDIRAFHDLVLESGPVPLSILEQRVDALIASAGQAAG
jgi:uncharacterized protein (DUF885 family)